MVKHQFQDILRFCQRLFRGAAGKDRQECQQLRAQLLKLQVAYDHLQQKSDHQQQERDRSAQRWSRLQSTYQQLQRDHMQLQQRADRLLRANADLESDRNNHKDYFDHAAQENDVLSEERDHLLEELHRPQQMLRESEHEIEAIADQHGRLMGRVATLEKQLSLRQYQDGEDHPQAEKRLAADPETLTAQNFDVWPLTKPDLTGLSVAIVGAHETSFSEVQKELDKQGLRRCIHVLPHSRESNSRQQIEDKISSCHLVVVATSHVDHMVSRNVKHLDKHNRLAGKVIWTRYYAKSGLLREIFQHFADTVSPSL